MSKIVQTAKRAASIVVPLTVAWKVLGGRVDKDAAGTWQKVSILGIDVYDAKRREARLARRRARRG